MYSCRPEKTCHGYALILLLQKAVTELISSSTGKIKSMIGNFLGTSMGFDLLVYKFSAVLCLSFFSVLERKGRRGKGAMKNRGAHL